MTHGLSEDDWEAGEYYRDRQMEREWDARRRWRIVLADDSVKFVNATKCEKLEDGSLVIWHGQLIGDVLLADQWRSAAQWEGEDETA